MLSRRVPAIATIAFACLSAACSSRSVEGLELALADGTSVGVSSSARDDPAILVPGTAARFVFDRPAELGDSEDLAVFVSGSGRMDARLLADRKGTVAAAGRFELAAAASELRIRAPGGASVVAVELRAAAGATIALTGFAVRGSFAGFAVDGDAAKVDATTTVVSESSGNSAVLSIPRTIDSSLVLRFADDGKAAISAIGADGSSRLAFEATIRAGDVLAIPAEALPGAAAVSVRSAAAIRYAAFEPGMGAPLSDLHAILAAPPFGSGDYRAYRWDALPHTLVLDFADYATQDRYLKRLAFFAEKPGFRGRLAPDGEIARLHGWNAHDYSTATLAAFYTKAGDTNFRLGLEELELLDLLVSWGVLTRDGSGRIGEGSGALISISRESTGALRRLFLDHESSHALFFQDPEYRRLSARLWSSLGPEAERFWRKHLVWRRYDVKDEYLCVNELQAYLVQQGVSSTGRYFENVASQLGEAYPDDRTIALDAPYAVESAVADALELDRYLRRRWGLSAGRFGRVRKP